MTKCPYCKQKIDGVMSLPPMPNRQRTIYEAVAAAGSKGITKSELVSLIESNGPGGHIVLRVQVHQLNKALNRLKQRVRGGGGWYRLIDLS